MRRYLHRIALCAVVLFGVSTLTGCQLVRKKFGIMTEVVDPEEDTPEWVVQQVMEAAMVESRMMRRHGGPCESICTARSSPRRRI